MGESTISSSGYGRKSSEKEDATNVDEQIVVVHTLLNFDAPHFFTKFTLVGCLPGLEILDRYEHLLIYRKLQSSNELQGTKRLMAYSQFEVKNSRGMLLYVAVERVSRSSLTWNRDARLFEVTFYDFHCRKVFTVQRQWSCKYCFAQYLCLFFTYGFQKCGNAVKVTLPDGTLIGYVRQKLSFDSTVLYIYNSSDTLSMVIRGITDDGILDVFFPGEDEPIAMVEILMDSSEAQDFYRASVPTRASATGITFFKNFLTPDQKALLLSSAVLLDYIFLKPTSDYIHKCEVIPNDYVEYPFSKPTLHRDQSRELIIFEEGKLRKPARRKTCKQCWGYKCCSWFAKLCCMWYALGLKRNAVRCILLTIAVIIVITVLVLSIMFMIMNKVWL